MDLLDLFPITTGRTATGGLSISGIGLSTLAQEYGTPLYLYDAATVRHEVGELRRLTQTLYPAESEITYASKAYLSLGFARHLVKMGIGIDVVSRGEMKIARMAGFAPTNLHLHGNNKSEEELRLALEWGIQSIVVDSLEELAFLESLAKKLKKTARIWLRVTPEVNVDTHPYRQTAHAASKFGLPMSDGQAAVGIRQAMKSKYLDLTGLHMHLGSQVFETEPFERAIGLLYRLAERENFVLREISPGGGWGVPYNTEDEDRPVDGWVAAISRAIQAEAGKRKWPLPKMILEPGRRIVARAGVAIYTIGTTKYTASEDAIITVDGGMADNIRPALYKAKYTACLVERPEAEPMNKTIIVGKFCESGDRLITGIGMPDVKRGDLLAIPVAGAYQLSMSSNYNLADRPAVLWLDDGKVEVLQKREKPEEGGWWVNL